LRNAERKSQFTDHDNLLISAGTNTWLVGNGESKVLIDTGEGFSSEKYVKFLLETVFPLTKTKNISLILLTHGHADHLGGVTTLLKELKKLGQPTPKVFKRQVLNGKYPPVGFVCEHIAEGQCFNASENSDSESIVIKSVYSAGHTDDHVAFTLQVRSD
jgi:glyoxylase-like metal-dependent hydrolase (beta-lactamase superfamily II)